MNNATDLQSDQQTGAASNKRPGALLAFAALFGLLLGLSLATLAFSLGAYLAVSGRAPMLAEPQPTGVVLAISIATSLVSLVGLLSTNLLAWRREAREARASEVQLQRERLEIEKLKRELEKQKGAE